MNKLKKLLTGILRGIGLGLAGAGIGAAAMAAERLVQSWMR